MLAGFLARLALPWLRGYDRPTPTPAAMRAAQDRIRARLVAELAPLPVGRARGLDRLPLDERLPEAFRREVPLATYADYLPLLERAARGEADVLFPGKPVALAITSGTTSAGQAGERFIPQSPALLEHHRAGAAVAFTRLVDWVGADRLLTGRLLLMGGSTDLKRNAFGVPYGDLSGIVVSLIPRLLWSLYEPGREIALMSDWEAKLAAMSRRVARADLRLASGIGSWMLALFAAVCRERGVERVRDAWPRLAAVVHGGHAMEPLIPQFQHHLPSDIWMQEVYPASEAFIAVGCKPWRLGDGRPAALELLCDHGVLLEFCPDSDPRPEACVGPEALEPGGVYRVILTTPGGLIRWQIGDLVRAEAPGLVRFAGRIKTRLSLFGEHVEGDLLAQALAVACAATGARIRHSHVAPVLPSASEGRGAHEWLVQPEPDAPPFDVAAFAEAIDRHLRAHSADYDAHRVAQLAAPRITVLPDGAIERWLASKGKLGGQHKVPQAWEDRTIAEQILAAR
ncbi:MAG: GH3 auxin-responsive promoter family protein [Planctomycetota bacterium]|nr:GH3 auxin-responsive promoter family protein [Planctomycetota bacterium]